MPGGRLGVSPGVHRAHIAAAVRAVTGCSVVLLCADETDGRRLQADLAASPGEEVPLLAGREFVFHDATASRQWEHRRLSLFHALLPRQSPPGGGHGGGAASADHAAGDIGPDRPHPASGGPVQPGRPHPPAGRPPDTPGAARWRDPASSPSGAGFWISTPRRQRPRCGRSSGEMRSTPWVFSTLPPSAGLPTLRRPPSSPPRRSCPN